MTSIADLSHTAFHVLVTCVVYGGVCMRFDKSLHPLSIKLVSRTNQLVNIVSPDILDQ